MEEHPRYNSRSYAPLAAKLKLDPRSMTIICVFALFNEHIKEERMFRLKSELENEMAIKIAEILFEGGPEEDKLDDASEMARLLLYWAERTKSRWKHG